MYKGMTFMQWLPQQRRALQVWLVKQDAMNEYLL